MNKARSEAWEAFSKEHMPADCASLGDLTYGDLFQAGWNAALGDAAARSPQSARREQFDAWFAKRWPEFEHPTNSAFEVWQAAAAEGYDAGFKDAIHKWEASARSPQSAEPVIEEAAHCCDTLAAMMENGAGEPEPGARLRQAAQMIRALAPPPTQSAETLSQPWVGCHECDCIFACHDGKARCIRNPLLAARASLHGATKVVLARILFETSTSEYRKLDTYSYDSPFTWGELPEHVVRVWLAVADSAIAALASEEPK